MLVDQASASEPRLPCASAPWPRPWPPRAALVLGPAPAPAARRPHQRRARPARRRAASPSRSSRPAYLASAEIRPRPGALEILGFEPVGGAGAPPCRSASCGSGSGRRDGEVEGAVLTPWSSASAPGPAPAAGRPRSRGAGAHPGRDRPRARPGRLAPYLERAEYLAGAASIRSPSWPGISGMRSQTCGHPPAPGDYDPASGRLRVYRRLAIAARIVGGDRARRRRRPSPASNRSTRASCSTPGSRATAGRPVMRWIPWLPPALSQRGRAEVDAAAAPRG